MLRLWIISLVACSRIQKILRPGAREVYGAVLDSKDVELTIQLNQYSDMSVYYKIVRPGEVDDDSDIREELVEAVDVRYTIPGEYRIEVYNDGPEKASISVYTDVMSSGSVDNDNLAIKNLFLDLEAKLMSLHRTNTRLKTIQENNIAEARRIRNGLYIMFAIPIMYVIIGLAKLHTIKAMFAPKKGSRI
ncbi:putative VESICLE TRANSPORT V-SNARE PROTEIN [Encephalitozoon cuniculi GB-M1]|uniref:VESICLE TRANSPORT V-SNARE PROTEIN n=2 Tax=Encephalitozoon cuniculi TaxID=6035 RepID=Q8SS45_ENCCU|nr:uncharacterized protein ECU04_0800 [Encephalitozoon cuniculi GB-M1]AGE95312.1 putative vesicle transport v-snare protein [Encephalitozoon cuniculi]KMV66283.1 hypothetical protein M970_040730 [Encephalitozoon cuniculi EcunIII-L]UYI27459.1 hypothetical protein J0A71_06g13290 [Encephalitozoon cuniculi]CAD25267.1 putative VESICLE TRANSPORT V-SNARE PROTEIN [Encephalitozoon cuniculi GB-M1]